MMHNKARPSVGQIYGIGRNYPEHAKELGNPVPKSPLVFLKSQSSLRYIEDDFHWPVRLRDQCFHHEVEIVLRVGRELPVDTFLEEGNPLPFSHFCLGIDVTRRDVQAEEKKQGHPWFLSKSFLGSSILAPWISYDTIRYTELKFYLNLNQKRVQEGHMSQMIFDPRSVLNFLLESHSLKDGDIIFTGTPEGVGPLFLGDTLDLGLLDSDYQHTFVF